MELAQKAFTHRVMEIDPPLAQQMLAANTGNFRPLNDEQVNSFADQMAAGAWQLGASIVRFGRDGKLVDGQHTLSAIVKSGKTVETSVFFGVPAEAVLAIDTGRPRTTPDIFRHLDVPFPTATAAALQAVRMVLGDYVPGQRAIAPQTLYSEWYEKYREAVDWAVGLLYKNANPCRNQAVAGALALTYRHGTKGAMADFAEKLVVGAELSVGSPALAVRKYFIEKGLAYKTDTKRTRALKVLGAAKAYLDGEQLTKLYADTGLRALEYFVKDEEAIAQAQQAA